MVSKYTISGALVNPGFIDTFQAGDIVTSGDKLFVQSLSENAFSEYTTSGKVVNRALISPVISGANFFSTIAVVSGSEQQVPDTGSTCLLLLLGLTAMSSVKRSIRRA